MLSKNTFVMIAFLGLAACGYYREDYPGSPAQTSPGVPNGPKPLNYETVNAILVANRCVECHSEAGRNRGRVNLETFEKVKGRRSAILDQIDMGLMPDDTGPRVSAADRQTLGEWVDAGAPL